MKKIYTWRITGDLYTKKLGTKRNREKLPLFIQIYLVCNLKTPLILIKLKLKSQKLGILTLKLEIWKSLNLSENEKVIRIEKQWI